MKFATYGLMLWLPMFLQINGYGDYQTAITASIFDIGNVIGGVLIGYLSDLTYSRRTPLAALCILLATGMMVVMIMISPSNIYLFAVYIFFLGNLLGGAIAIISGISCADLVISVH
jgi:sugar phosphate permease